MKILIGSIELNNFMKINHLKIDANNQNITVCGRNGTGKTTITKAIKWVLTGKDDEGNAPGSTKFPIKTTDEYNNVIHKLEHEVELKLVIDWKDIALKKVYREKWTKKRGTNAEEMTGHETLYYIDDVPLQEKEYQNRIAEIADEKTWRLLIDPLYFSAGLEWKDRRNLLFEAFGDMTDEEIIKSDIKLLPLKEILNGRKMDDYKAIAKAQIKKIKDDLDSIPARISENKRMLPDVDGLKAEYLPGDIAKLREQLQAKQQEKARIESGGEAAELKKQLAEKETELIKLKNKARAGLDSKTIELREVQSRTQTYGTELSGEIKKIEIDIESNTKRIEKIQKQIETLVASWESENEREFAFEQSSICPTCGQALPEEQLTEAREKALEQFNLDKSHKLEELDKEGEKASGEIDKLSTENEALQKTIEKIRNDYNAARKEYANITQQINELQNQDKPDPTATVEIEKINDEIAEINKSISNLWHDKQEAIGKVQDEISNIQDDISTLEQAQAKIKQYESSKKRIAELEAEEKRLNKEYEKLQGELFLMEEFVRVKCSLITDKINGNFKMAKFKLFDVQVNGAVVECCETLGNGIGFNCGLNQGHQILTGIDIINNMLQPFYGIIAPIIIDNAESLTEQIETQAQVVRLKAKENENKLKVEVA